jgi:hypothetical protein
MTRTTRCKKGERRFPPKTGDCASKVYIKEHLKNKKCPKGTRKNRKTGNCEKQDKKNMLDNDLENSRYLAFQTIIDMENSYNEKELSSNEKEELKKKVYSIPIVSPKRFSKHINFYTADTKRTPGDELYEQILARYYNKNKGYIDEIDVKI